jgi:type III pantothenate kinase
MRLLVDVGNTRIKWGQLEGEVLTAPGAFIHGGDSSAAVAALLDVIKDAPDALLVANVAGGDFEKAISREVAVRWNMEPQFASTQPSAGRLRNAYADHTRLGVDRWLAMLAAAARFSDAVYIVDAGTAVTLDLIAADGEHLGGYILPGLDLMRRALTGDTGDLVRFTAGEAANADAAPVPGRTTAEAIDHGAVAAVCALIDRCARSSSGDNRQVVVTGGDAGRIVPHLAVGFEHRPHLVLEGLALWKPG